MISHNKKVTFKLRLEKSIFPFPSFLKAYKVIFWWYSGRFGLESSLSDLLPMIGATILLVSMQLLEAEERYTSIKPLYFTTVAIAKCMEWLLPLFLNVCLAHLGYSFSILISRGQIQTGGKEYRQNHRADWRGGVHTWEPNKELVILGKGIWELPNRFEIRMLAQRWNTRTPHLKLSLWFNVFI